MARYQRSLTLLLKETIYEYTLSNNMKYYKIYISVQALQFVRHQPYAGNTNTKFFQNYVCTI